MLAFNYAYCLAYIMIDDGYEEIIGLTSTQKKTWLSYPRYINYISDPNYIAHFSIKKLSSLWKMSVRVSDGVETLFKVIKRKVFLW